MIILIVTLCVAVTILSVSLPLSIHKNEKESLGIDEWTADIYVTLKSTSGVRLIFEDDVADAVGDKARVIGEFSLTGFSKLGDGEKTQVNIGAYDLARADSFFEIRYIEYGKITNNNIDKVAIIGERFANEHGLTIGDTVEVNVLGEKFSYVVEAVAKETGALKRDDMMVDISSVRKALAERSPLIASLPLDIEPYTNIHVSVNDGFDAEELKAELEALESFGDKRAELTADDPSGDYMTTVLTATIAIPAALLLTIAVMMMVSTLELLEKKRASDVALFRIVGADSGHLNRILYLEGAVYGASGGVLGSLLSIPAIAYLNELYGFRYSRMSFGAKEALIGLASAMALTMLSIRLHIRKRNDKISNGELSYGKLDTGRRFSYKKLLPAVPVAVLAVTTLLLPSRLRYISCAALLFTAITAIYVISPYVAGGFAMLVSRVASKGRGRAGKTVLASGSCINSYPLRHAGRIMTVLITVFISLAFVLSAVEDHLLTYTSFAEFDYIGMRVDDETKERIEGLDGVVATAESIISRNVLIGEDIVTVGIAVEGDVDECFEDKILPKSIPQGNSVALSSGVARMLGLKVGDGVKCEIDGIPCELILTEIVATHGDFAYYDAEYVGVRRDMLCVLTDGTEEARDSLVAIFDERGIECLTEDVFFSQSNRVIPQLTTFKAMFCVMVFMTVIGVFNVLAEQRMERRREFDIIRQNGATRKDVFAIQAIEISILFVAALLSSVLFSYFVCVIVDTAATSFGMTLYL